MGKLHQLLRPYTFRNRMMVALLACSLVAALISLICSFLYSSVRVREELTERQQAIAIYILELSQKTDLSIHEIIRMADNDSLVVAVDEADASLMPDELRETLASKMIVTTYKGLSALPCTYVQVGEQTLTIMPNQRLNIFLMSFIRIGFAALSFLMVFVMMAWLASNAIAKPISLLTRATRQVRDGDFTVKLPEKEDMPDELGELMVAFNGMTDALSRTSYLQKDFIASISHEFRTPIASIRGFARLLQMPGLDEAARREYVDMIAQESDRLSRLSETLLRLSALEQQAAPAGLSAFRLDEQIRQVILRLQPAWNAHDITWQLDLEPVAIVSDSELLTQVWINLIQNAVKFSHDSGLIEISVTQTDVAEVRVTDHGVGMDESTLARIFDRFYQADVSRGKQGVGLGLCLVKRILDILSGSIHVRSTPGQGSSFRVRLPLDAHHTTLEDKRP